MKTNYKIFQMTPELKGMVSLGGLAEVVTALAFALKRAGHDVRIMMPYYACLDHESDSYIKPSLIWQRDLNVGKFASASVYSTAIYSKKDCIPVLLVKGHPWFDQADVAAKIYAPENQPEPYFFMAAVALKFIYETKEQWFPQIVHCHDYHTGLLPVYLRTVFHDGFNRKIATVFTIHNLGYHGNCSADSLEAFGLPCSLGQYMDQLSTMEYYGKINCLKGALCFSDQITTVSKRYVKEVMTTCQGNGFQGILKSLEGQGRFTGIVNAIDNEAWDPNKLGRGFSFDTNNFKGKKRAKGRLQESCGLEKSKDPIIAIRSRWAYQKGLELLLYALRHFELHKYAQILVIARKNGSDPDYNGLWYELLGWAKTFPSRIAFPQEDLQINQLQYGGSDMLLMPSLYEPCGIASMEAMRFGTIPVFRRTGGLIDILNDDYAYGFDWVFNEPIDRHQIMEGCKNMMAVLFQAITDYQYSALWEERMKMAMSQSHDWADRIPEYENVYQQAVNRQYF
jgi:starch synthase